MLKRAVLASSIAIILVSTGCAKRKRRVSAPVAAIPQAAQTGLASWYGHPYHGRPAADGEIYDMEALVAAHRTLPFNTWVRVTNTLNQKFVDVRIIDRGPFVDGRIIDLSHAAARQIDLIGPGVAPVRVEIVSAPPAAEAELYAVQIGAFQDRDRAERWRESLEREFGTARIVLRQGNPNLWRVLVGREISVGAAHQLAERVRERTREAFVVRLDAPAAAQHAAQHGAPGGA